MRISDWSSDVCSSDLDHDVDIEASPDLQRLVAARGLPDDAQAAVLLVDHQLDEQPHVRLVVHHKGVATAHAHRLLLPSTPTDANPAAPPADDTRGCL